MGKEEKETYNALKERLMKMQKDKKQEIKEEEEEEPEETEEEQEEIKEEKEEPKLESNEEKKFYPRAVSIEQMFNTIDDKLDLILSKK